MLKPERQAPDGALAIAIGAHAIIVAAIIWKSSIAVPADASLMQHVNLPESTIDIMIFADNVTAAVRSAAASVIEQKPLPKVPEFRIPDLSDGNIIKFRESRTLATANMGWASPAVPQRDTTTRNLDVHELADAPRFTSFSRAPSLRNGEAIQRYLKKHFPLALRRSGGEARAVIWLLVDAQGRVFKAVLRETSGRNDTDSVAVTASYLMEFDPAEQAGRTVPVWVQQPVRFHVQDIF